MTWNAVQVFGDANAHHGSCCDCCIGYCPISDQAEARAEAAEAEVVTLRAKVAAVQALAEKRDVLYPPKWAFGAEENYCNGYRQARADFIAAMATGEGQ